MNFFSHKKNQKGFLTVELVVATSVIVVATLVALSVAERSIKVSRRAFNSAQAAFLLEEGSEAVRVARDASWSNISGLALNTDYYPTFAGGTWTLSTTPNQVGMFTRTVTVASVNRDNMTRDISSIGTEDPNTKLITVTVSWSDGDSTITKTLQFYIADIFSS
jgi:Tfp pilus assembly protein PilV